jgi:tetratricopeptide (TPR) repeat protein
MKKEEKTYKPKKVSNPASTGAAGPTFEHRVQASRLLAMCLGHPIPGRTDGRIVELRFQGRVHGHHTDDLVCTFEDHAGVRSRILLQMKRSMSSRETDDAFSDAVGGAWLDFTNLAHFTRGADSFFLIYDNASARSMAAAGIVSNRARRSPNAGEFLHKVKEDAFSNAANRNALTAIRAVASNYAGRPITDEEAFEFIKHLNFYSQDLDREDTPEHIGYLKDITTAAAFAKQTANPREDWAALVSICAGLNKDAATVTFDELNEVLGSRLNLLFATARNGYTSALGIVAPSSPGPSTVPDQVAVELSKLSGLVESLHREQTTRTADDAAPTARESSVNKLVSRQLDSINQRIKALRYSDALAELQGLGEDQSAFDAHQRARWMLLRATCRWHLEGAKAAADDFIAAAELCDDDDKLAAARVRGLLLKDEVTSAVRAGEETRARFPNSLAVWQIYVNARILNGESLGIGDIPPEHAEEPDALHVIAWGMRKQGNLKEAVELALAAIAKPSATFFTRELALNLTLEKAAGNAFLSTYKLADAGDRQALAAAAQAFTPRGQRLWDVQSPDTLNATAHNLSMAYLLLREPEEALNVISEARSHGIDSPDLLRIELDALTSTNRTDKALARGRAELNRLPKEGLATFAQFAAETGDVGAVEAAIEAAGRLNPRESKLDQMLTALRWEAMGKVDKARVLAEIQSTMFDDKSSIAELVVAGRIFLADDPAKATSLVDMAASRLTATTESGERFLIGQLMLSAKRLDKAVEVYESILPIGQHSPFHNDLLFCYIRLGQRVRAKELLDSFPEGWEADRDARALAMELGQQAGDWDLLSKLVAAQLSEFPNAASSWLFRVMVASRVAEHEVAKAVAEIPAHLTGNLRQLTQVASLELQHGQKEQALRRLYAMRRANMDSVEAASAHLIAHIAITDDLPSMEDSLETIVPGSSVTLTAEDGATIVYTIDPVGLENLPKSQEFVGCDSAVAKILQGARVGSEIAIQDNFGGRHLYVVGSVRSAFRRLLDLSQLAHQTSLVPSKYVASVSLGHDSGGKVDFSELEKQLKRSGDIVDHVLDIYQTSPVTLGDVSKMLGRNILDIVRGWRNEGPALQVGSGNREEQKAALARLIEPTGVYVVDAATLAELALVDGLNLLGTLPSVFATSATRDIVEGHLNEVKQGRSEGTAFLHEGQLAYREFAEQDRAQEVAVLKAIADAIRAYCHVAPAYGTKDIAALANQVQGAVSAEEHAVLLLAAEKQATLLSVDVRLRSLALGLFRLQGVWPQVFLAAARKRGVLSDDGYSLAVIKWFLANRSFISVSSNDLALMAYQGTSWLRYGIDVLAGHIASPNTEFESGARVSFGFLRLLTEGPCHFGPVARMLERISEALHRHKNCPENYAAVLTRAVHGTFANCSELEIRLLVQAVYIGADRARQPKAKRPLKDVQVLMCSNRPWIAYVPDNADNEAKEPTQRSVVETPKTTVDDSPTVPSPEAKDKTF